MASKINLDRKNLLKVCKNNSRSAVKDNFTIVFILTDFIQVLGND